MNWFRNFMIGRYGADQLSWGLLATSFLISLIVSIFQIPFLGILSYIPLFFCIYRMFSRNLLKRSTENQKFLVFWNRLKGWFYRKSQRIKDCKTYRFFSCPNCRQTLRLPKGRGKIRITCPKCGRVFERKT